ncbi:MAG: hypothetical protein ACI4GZ_03120 [Ruminococcus sp.]
MRLNEVINRFALISDLSAEEVSKWTPVCIDAYEELNSMLLSPKSADESLSRKFSSCAGALAYYKYCLYSSQNVKSLTAGSMSVTVNDDTVEKAKVLWETERESIAQHLKGDSSFCFKRVRA